MLALFSCNKKEEKAGLEIQPDENRLEIIHINLDKFTTFSERSEAVKTSRRNSSILLGSINDDTFGRTSAFLLSQYRLSSDNVEFGNNSQILSAIAYLSISEIVGNSKEELHYKVYKSDFDIDPDSAYYSNIDISNSIGEIVADTSFSIDSFSVMRIPLFKSFGQTILDASSSTLENNDNFLSKFKGLYFTVDTTQTSGGVIWKYDFNSPLSYILLEYTNENSDGTLDTNTFKLQFNEASGRFNQFFHNTASLSSTLGLPSDKVYISGMGGLKAHISLSPILSWRDSSKVMIYKAELLVKAKSSGISSVPEKLLMEVDNMDEDVKFVDDYLPNTSSNYGGDYDAENKTYSMVITRHIQNLINKNQNDSLLWLYPYNQIINPYRVILLNGEDDENFTLRITYSKLY